MQQLIDWTFTGVLLVEWVGGKLFVGNDGVLLQELTAGEDVISCGIVSIYNKRLRIIRQTEIHNKDFNTCFLRRSLQYL
uniref:Putative secreted protein n=1 Tax=Anopheles marajoara TaxID=58244 RepID=A0A2M4CD68_9DIPT